MLYTKKGDGGMTSKFDGTSIWKDGRWVELLGVLDEVEAWMGLVLFEAKNFNEKILDFFLVDILTNIQKGLFTLRSIVAKGNTSQAKLDVGQIEKLIDFLEKELPVLRNFLQIGGNKLALQINYLRVLTRKAERRLVVLAKKENFLLEVLPYLNRLSDLFFALYRFVNINSGFQEKMV